MDGLFQLLIVLVFVVVSILDGVSRKKRQQEQKERMEQAEAEEQAGMEDPVFQETGSSARPSSQPPVPSAPSGRTSGSGERETADQMVPADLWAILTGQAPMPGEERPVPRQEQAPPQTPEPVVIPAPPPPAPAPTPAPVPVRVPQPAPVQTRRSSRWMEGLDREPAQVRKAGQPVPDGLDEESVWSAYQDISEGEIGSADEDGLRYDEEVAASSSPSTGAASVGRSSRPRGRGTTASKYAALVTSGREEDLRSAIVLREVLGPPVGSRGPLDR